MTLTSTGAVFFYPETNATLVCTSASSNVNIGNSGDVLVISNVGTAEAFIGWGVDSTASITAGGTVTAAGTSTIGMSIAPGVVQTLRAVPATPYIAGITNAGSTTLRISRGSGQ